MKRILVAGIGNIFFGDDAFGCEVASALLSRPMPAGVRVQDFGIRSYDLAYALMDCDAAILVDAIPREEEPGTLFVIEPDLAELDRDAETVDAHSMNPVRVLQMVRALGGQLPKLYLVGCVPGILEPKTGDLALSEAVRAAIPHAIEMIDSLLQELTHESAGTTVESALA